MRKDKYQEKMTDKAFSRMIFSSLCGFVICLICLSTCTWALYSTDISSAANVLRASNFEVSVGVTNSSEETTVIQSATELVPDTYEVHISNVTGSKGHCEIYVDDAAEPLVITPEFNSTLSMFSFQLYVGESGHTFRFVPSWEAGVAHNIEAGQLVSVLSEPGVE